MVYLDYYQYICSVTNWMSLLASLKGVTSIIWFSPLPVFCRYVLSWPKLFILLAELLALYLLHYPNARSSAKYCKVGKVEIRKGKIPQWFSGRFFLVYPISSNIFSIWYFMSRGILQLHMWTCCFSCFTPNKI